MEKIVLLYLQTGGGHYSAAKALAEQIHRTDEGIAHLLNPLEENLLFLRKLIETGYAKLHGNFRFAWPLLYRMSCSKQVIRGYHKFMETFLTETLVRIFTGVNRPEKVVILHFLLIAPVRRAMELLGISAENCITIVLDPFSVHPIWYRENPFPIFCFSDRAASTILLDGGVEPDRVQQFSMIISDRFSQKYIMEESRRDRLPRILILGGGEGSSRSFRLLKALLKHRQDLEIHFVCGKSESLYRIVSRFTDRSGQNNRVQIYRFVENLEHLISRADLVLTKAGPASIMECLLLGKPILLFDYMYGQEQGNVDFVEENGLGQYIANPQELREILDHYLGPSYWEEFSRKLDALDLQTGTQEIVSNILKISPIPCI